MINGENLSNKMTKADPMAKYDAYAKEILAEKSVLSFVMANVIPEYQGMDPQNNILGEVPKDKFRYDLLNVIFIGLPAAKWQVLLVT